MLFCGALRGVACIWVNRCVIADYLKRISLGGIEDILKSYLLRRAGELVSTAWSPFTLDDATLPESLEYLLGVLEIEPLALGDFERPRCSVTKIFR